MYPSTQQVTILFADIAGSTRLYDTFGDVKAQELITYCLSFLKRLIIENDGKVVNTIGDAVLCTFKTPNQAAETARQMHEEISFDWKMMNADIRLRIGFHHGGVILAPADVFGDAVNVAARMGELAKSDQIITNKETLALMQEDLRFSTRIVDRTRVRGKDDIMEIHELIWGNPGQMTITMRPEQVIASLTAKQNVLQIRFRNYRVQVDNKKPILTLGRGMTNHLIVDHPVVSRMHASIELYRGRFMLFDKSTNGTFVKPREAATVILRRDEMQLEKEGIIGLGQKVDDYNPLTVRYRIL
ncbi:MAG: adenylate/guanylate cyclase domain-containing protein [Proteobacteria bacterium]|nr:adenylate/guanylate cyclase domain-containing protein [Pseudomonadota bacterium]